MTRIEFCGCKQPFQDTRYGEHRRVFNYAPKKGTDKTRWRCTACGTAKNFADGTKR